MYKIFSLILFNLLFSILFFHLSAKEIPPYTIIENQAKLEILSPTLKNRKTIKIKLKNGLEAYLISDPKLDYSGAMLTVNAGQWSDPADFPGLAHFLEHMLFLGTAKYPKESEFDLYVTENGGISNAFTSNDFTSFMYSIKNQAYKNSLDRFSSFFKEPLFNPSGVSREMQAIDQEFAKNVEDDDVRLIHIIKELGNKGHPFSHFGMGNSKTLQNVTRETFLNWYKTHYSANLMKLVAISNLPIEKLTEIVVADFQDIPNYNLTQKAIDQPLASNETQGKMLYIVPVKDITNLILVWDIPSSLHNSLQELTAYKVILEVLGHEGEKSLLAQLKKEDLAEALKCGFIQTGGHNYQLYLEVELTRQGLSEVNTVIERIFQAIENFKTKGAPKYLFDEIQQMAKTKYQYQSDENVFTAMVTHGSQLPHYDIAGYPENSLVPKTFNQKGIADFLKVLTPGNAFIALTASPEITGVKPDKKEQWLGTEYAIRDIPSELLSKWSNAKAHPNIDLPPPNPFIPKNLTLIEKPSVTQKEEEIIPPTKKIVENEISTIYHSQDTHFLLPKVSYYFTIKTPQVDVGAPQKVVLADLYVNLLDEALNQISYPATIAGLEYAIKREDFGISIVVQGYSDKAPLLFSEILKNLKNFKTNETEFAIQKALLMREYQNAALDTPLKQGEEVLKTVLYKKHANSKAKANVIKKVSFETFTEYTENLFKKSYVEGMLYGNLTESQAKDLSQQLIYTLSSAPYLKKDHKKLEVIVLPEDKGPFYLEVPTKVQGNGILLTIANGDYSFQKRAAQQILIEAMSQPFFIELRTQQQTGYIVYNDAEDLENHLFSLFIEQSNTHEPRDLLARFEQFIEHYLQELPKQVPPEKFQNLVGSFETILRKPAKNMSEMAGLLNQLAFKFDGDFERINKRIKAFQELTYDEFQNFSKEFVGRTNKQRLAIMIKGTIPENHLFQYKALNNISELRKMSKYVPGKPK